MRRHSTGRLPTFLFVGADKTGSTWLFDLLTQHPGAYVPPAKDIYFFDRYYDRGLDWYKRFFPAAPNVTVVGEICHDYLYSRRAAERIAHDLPGVRLFVFLREPADRCFSEYLYLDRSGLTQGGFRETLAARPEVIEHSRYAYHLRPYLDMFGAAVDIRFFEDLCADPKVFASSLLETMGLDPEVGIVPARSLPAARARSTVAARAAKKGAHMARWLGRPSLVGRAKRTQLARALYRPYGADRPRLAPEDRALVYRLLADDLIELADIVGVGRSAWVDAAARQLKAAR